MAFFMPILMNFIHLNHYPDVFSNLIFSYSILAISLLNPYFLIFLGMIQDIIADRLIGITSLIYLYMYILISINKNQLNINAFKAAWGLFIFFIVTSELLKAFIYYFSNNLHLVRQIINSLYTIVAYPIFHKIMFNLLDDKYFDISKKSS